MSAHQSMLWVLAIVVTLPLLVLAAHSFAKPFGLWGADTKLVRKWEARVSAARTASSDPKTFKPHELQAVTPEELKDILAPKVSLARQPGSAPSPS